VRQVFARQSSQLMVCCYLAVNKPAFNTEIFSFGYSSAYGAWSGGDINDVM